MGIVVGGVVGVVVGIVAAELDEHVVEKRFSEEDQVLHKLYIMQHLLVLDLRLVLIQTHLQHSHVLMEVVMLPIIAIRNKVQEIRRRLHLG